MGCTPIEYRRLRAQSCCGKSVPCCLLTRGPVYVAMQASRKSWSRFRRYGQDARGVVANHLWPLPSLCVSRRILLSFVGSEGSNTPNIAGLGSLHVPSGILRVFLGAILSCLSACGCMCMCCDEREDTARRKACLKAQNDAVYIDRRA